MKESPIFSKTYDFVSWVIPLTIKFPRQQRFVLASVLQAEAFKFQGLLIDAVHHQQPIECLNQADAELDKIRIHLRLGKDLSLLTVNQYEHAARMLVEIGRLLGGWKKSIAVR